MTEARRIGGVLFMGVMGLLAIAVAIYVSRFVIYLLLWLSLNITSGGGGD